MTSDDSNLFNVQSLEELVLEKPSTKSKLSELTPTKEKRKIAEIEKSESNDFSEFDHVNVCVWTAILNSNIVDVKFYLTIDAFNQLINSRINVGTVTQ